jgi:hypothetical protein
MREFWGEREREMRVLALQKEEEESRRHERREEREPWVFLRIIIIHTLLPKALGKI